MFKISKKSKTSQARAGILETAHGKAQTPFFMPIATKASVKTLDSFDLAGFGAEIILSNTYHLMLRPGIEVIKKAGGLRLAGAPHSRGGGGLHKFMNWPRAILTDSGGYQVFSLAKQRKIKEDGVEFRSHIDGKKFILTPELSLEIQKNLGVDIAMILDICSPYPCSKEDAEESMKLTTEWAKRSKKFKLKKGQMKFGIVQGSVYSDLRLKSAEDLVKLDFDGYAVGGLAVGEPREEMFRILKEIVPKLPEDKPRYLMGVGQPEEIVEAVRSGIDMFDCVLPTRNARHGLLYVWRSGSSLRGANPALVGKRRSNPLVSEIEGDCFAPLRYARNDKFYETIHITNEKFKKDFAPLDKNCSCHTCKNFSRAYLRHLFVAEEPLALRLATIHNVNFYLDLMRRIREGIKEGRF